MCFLNIPFHALPPFAVIITSCPLGRGIPLHFGEWLWGFVPIWPTISVVRQWCCVSRSLVQSVFHLFSRVEVSALCRPFELTKLGKSSINGCRLNSFGFLYVSPNFSLMHTIYTQIHKEYKYIHFKCKNDVCIKMNTYPVYLLYGMHVSSVSLHVWLLCMMCV